MIFKNIHDARDWFLKYKPLTEKVISFCYEYKGQWKFGDWILFQHIQQKENGEKRYSVYFPDGKLKCQVHTFEEAKLQGEKDIRQDHEQEISRPILAIFTNYKIWDQALVINFVQPQRAWMQSHEVITNPEINYSMKAAEIDDEVQAIQFWTDNIKVIAHWKQKPSIKELKQALK